MSFGFRPIMDFSTLSLKELNDQLEQIWIKIMGGITEKDIRQIVTGGSDKGQSSAAVSNNITKGEEAQ